MSGHDHELVLDGHPLYDWRLACVHGPDHYRTHDESRALISDDCWVQSWWNEMGVEMVDDRRVWPKPEGLSLPVDVEGDGFGDGPLLVPHLDPARRDGATS